MQQGRTALEGFSQRLASHQPLTATPRKKLSLAKPLCFSTGQTSSCPPAHIRCSTALSTSTLPLQLRTALLATAARRLQRRVRTQALNAGIPLPTSPETQNSWLLSTFPILRHQELISRVAWTLGVIALVRLGVFTKLPYVDARFAATGARSVAIEAMMGRSAMNGNHVFMLGLGPVINASICLSLCMALSSLLGPFGEGLKELQDQGSEGHAKIMGYVNLAALCFAIAAGAHEACMMARYATVAPGVPFVTLTTILLAAGAMIQRWLADLVDMRGIGEGVGLLLSLNIVSNYSQFLNKATLSVSIRQTPTMVVAGLSVAFMALVLLASLTTSLTLRLPLIYYKQRRSTAPNKSDETVQEKLLQAARTERQPGKQRASTAYLPLRISPNGMQPIIIASVLFDMLPMIVGIVNSSVGNALSGLLKSPCYPLLFGVAVFLASLAEVSGNTPKQMTDYLTAVEAGIKDVSPGQTTEKFLVGKMRETRFWGGLVTALLAVGAHYFDKLCFAQIGTSLGSMSLLLVVGVVTSAIRQIQSLLQKPRLEKALHRERSILQRMSVIGQRTSALPALYLHTQHQQNCSVMALAWLM